MARKNRRNYKSAAPAKSEVGPEVKLPKALPPKVKSSTPSTGVSKGQTLRRETKSTMVNSIADVRGASGITAAIRMLAKDDGVTSNAVFMASAIANTPIKLTAFDTNTQRFNPEATRALASIRASMDTLSDYTAKFNSKPTVRGFIAQALNELMICSGIGCELVMSKDRLPDYVKAVPYDSIEYQSDGNSGSYPVQKVKSGDDVPLDIPNFFIAELNKSPSDPYATPILRAAINSAISNGEFIEDMRRVVDRTGHSRLVVTIDAEMVEDAAPDAIKEDPKKLQSWLDQYQESVRAGLQGLAPEDSVVVYSNVDIEVADIGGSKSDYVPLMKTLNNLQSTSVKTPSSILGLRAEGSQSLSNVESLTYLKMLGALQGPVSDILSRAFTLAVRLYGFDVYAKATFAPINMRPEDELEAYRTMQSDRHLKNLSLGIWTQEQYCHESGNPYYEGMPDLSGTMFHEGYKTNGGDTDNSEGAQRTLTPDTPDKAGGGSQ